VNHQIVTLGLIVVAAVIGAALGSVSSNVALVSATFAAVAGGIGEDIMQANSKRLKHFFAMPVMGRETGG
jgi:NhaP-type Na+/H+ or K+/H+ antiporter